jgi:hypothetical protein
VAAPHNEPEGGKPEVPARPPKAPTMTAPSTSLAPTAV